MKTNTFIQVLICSFFFFFSFRFADAQTYFSHENWPAGEYREMKERIRQNDELNLLKFPGSRLVQAEGVKTPHLLFDGDAAANGRVQVGGKPARLVFYLGGPRMIKEILLFSANGDSRSNQDFEIRWANNEQQPGKMPVFPMEASLTSGNKILGANVGGFMTQIADSSGLPLSDEKKFDWVEFLIWQTFPSRAGDPAKGKNTASGWSAYVELQVVGDLNDPGLFTSEVERTDWQAARKRNEMERKLVEEIGEDALFALASPESLKRSIEHLSGIYPDRYDGRSFMARYERIVDSLKNTPRKTPAEQQRYYEVAKEFAVLRRDALLANPLLDFDRLLFRRARNAGLEANWISNASRKKNRYDNALAIVAPRQSQGEATTIIEDPNGSFVGDINLHWNAEKMLVTALASDKTWQVFELNIDGSDFQQVTPSIGADVDNVEGCFLPDGAVLFISTANMMGVPCVDGASVVGNIYRIEKDGKTIRQLTFEQDQDWCPVLLPNGRVMYQRWEYIDTSHYFTRILFHMNPDGTNQVEYYGSNSYWPNSIFYAKPIPGSSTQFAGIVTGHHGVARMGELVLFDITKGRKETEGVIQRIPGYEKPVDPIIKDRLVDGSWPKFLFPAPLDENHFLVSAQLTPDSAWCLYLVDVFDNMLKLREEPGVGLYEPTPLIKRPPPPIQPNRVDPASTTSNVFITDIYFGDGLKDVPRGSVKNIRLFTLNYGYRGLGGHDYLGMESCWDARRILGEVPVYEDGSASFTIPANTPIVLQPLDEQGNAMQLMRSWLVGMPGENQSCIGCHESQNTVTPSKRTIAMGKAPAPITPFLGPERPFSFSHEIQPVLDQYCVGCHDGTGENRGRPNFADKSPGYKGFSGAYHALHPFVRRPGPESDAHMFKPMEYHTSTSELFQRLEKGHHGVEIDDNSMRKLRTWVDLNVPYFGTWLEVAQANQNRKSPERITKIAERHSELKILYANIDLNPEKDAYAGSELSEAIPFVKPKDVSRHVFAPTVPGWPFDNETARKMQTIPNQTIKVDNLEIELAWIPSGKFVMGDECGEMDELPRSAVTIERPFFMMTTEVTNELYNKFDPDHDSRYIDQWWKDHTRPGYAANTPQQPVIRISWNRAVEFCLWLSKKTGKNFRLPTEAEWEWACRAGSATPMWYGHSENDFGKLENMSDRSTKFFVVRGVDPKPMPNPPDVEAFIPRAEGIDDGNMIGGKVGSYRPNPWGLFDMHGNVSEWTASDYRPYPYIDAPNDPLLRKTVRGGSWRDRPSMARSGIRRPYQPWQPVYNVGIRAVCDE